MIRPHEQTLTVTQFDEQRRCIHVAGDGVPHTVALLWNDAAAQWEQLLTAAPDMAQALLSSGHSFDGQWHTERCWLFDDPRCTSDCERTREALSKAGVPLP